MSKINPSKQTKEIINKNTKNKNRNSEIIKRKIIGKKINEAERLFLTSVEMIDFKPDLKRDRERFQIINP